MNLSNTYMQFNIFIFIKCMTSNLYSTHQHKVCKIATHIGVNTILPQFCACMNWSGIWQNYNDILILLRNITLPKLQLSIVIPTN